MLTTPGYVDQPVNAFHDLGEALVALLVCRSHPPIFESG
jgi:hypothetical protein